MINARLLTIWLLAALAPVALGQAPHPPVSVAVAGTGPVLEDVALTGTVTSPRVAGVSAAVAGKVAEVLVDAGDAVAAGDALVRLDDEIAGHQLAGAQAAVTEAEARLADTKRRLVEARELEDRRTIAATQVASLAAQVSIDDAALAGLRAAARLQAALVARHTVEAPFDGVVSAKRTEAGAWVTPGTAVLELVATDRLRLDFQAPQEYLPRIDGARLLVRNGNEEPVPATLWRVVPVADPTARTFLLRADAPNGLALAPGVSVQAVLRLGFGRESVLVPRDALVRYPDGRTTVWIVDGPDPEASVSERQVRTGLKSGGRVEILSGLDGGERVVVRGNEVLQENQKVRVVTSRDAIG